MSSTETRVSGGPEEGPGTSVKAPEPGPFAPPPDFAFEEEFDPLVPRPSPGFLRRGRYANARRRAIWGCFCAAAACLSASGIPLVRIWGLYFLPLAYLDWIGLGLLAIGGVSLFGYLVREGPFAYIRRGEPLAARVRDLVLTPAVIVNGQPSRYRFDAEIEFRDPDTGDLQNTVVRSNDFSAMIKDRLTTSFRVGDYVTAVRLPEKPEKSLQLYGFLGLRPGLGLVRRDGKAAAGPLSVVVTVLVISSLFGVLGFGLYALGRYQTIDEFGPAQLTVIGVGAVILGGALLGLLRYNQVRECRKRATTNAELAERGEPVQTTPIGRQGWFGANGLFLDLIIIVGGLLMGGVLALCAALGANALLDRSSTTFRPVRITEMTQITHDLIFRTYEIEYKFSNENRQSPRKLMSTPFEMIRVMGRDAVAEVHQGALGWAWVKAIVPAPGKQGM